MGGECFMRQNEIDFPLLSVIPTEHSMRTLDDFIAGPSPCGHDEMRNYAVILSAETMVVESTDMSVQKHIDAERLRYIEQYIKQRLYPASWIKRVSTYNRTDYESVFKARVGAPNYNYIEVAWTYC
jgi:hypothetical protein